jgi:hypothetical protein
MKFLNLAFKRQVVEESIFQSTFLSNFEVHSSFLFFLKGDS